MKRKLEIVLYPNTTSIIPDTDITNRVQNLSFSTHLHGGFHLCNFQLRADIPEAWEWITKKMFYRLVIRDINKTIWEGRLQDIGLTYGTVNATAYGYYASLNDGEYYTAYNANADVVIKAILTAQSPDINSDQSNIAATGGPAVTSAASASYLDRSPRELVELLADFGDTSGNTWYFAIWEDRKPYFFSRSIASINWFIGLEGLTRFELKHQGGNLWNKVYAIYDVAGTLTRTADASDVTSQNKYGVTRYYTIPQLGTVATATAQAIRDTWLADHKDLWPSLEDIVLGDYVKDSNGVQYPSSWVRAGDVICIQNLVPVSGDLTTPIRDALRTFYIMETQYNAERAENRLVLDTESQSLDAIVARIPKFSSA